MIAVDGLRMIVDANVYVAVVAAPVTGVGTHHE